LERRGVRGESPRNKRQSRHSEACSAVQWSGVNGEVYQILCLISFPVGGNAMTRRNYEEVKGDLSRVEIFTKYFRCPQANRKNF
jgi:hypothetical protein